MSISFNLTICCLWYGLSLLEFGQEDVEVFLFQFFKFWQEQVKPFADGSTHSNVRHLSIELIKNKTHASGKGSQVIILFCQSIVELLEVSHPFGCKLMIQHICFIEYQQKWHFSLVQDAQGIHHIRNKRVWVFASNSVSHV